MLDDYECPDPIRSYKHKVRVNHGKRQWRDECADEHIEATARPVRFIPPEVPPASRGLGEGAAAFVYKPCSDITDDPELRNLLYATYTVNLRDTEGASSGEIAT